MFTLFTFGCQGQRAYKSPVRRLKISLTFIINFYIAQTPTVRPRAHYIVIMSYQSINQSMAVTDAGTKVPLYPYHTFYTLLSPVRAPGL